jgi:hypothetical protein
MKIIVLILSAFFLTFSGPLNAQESKQTVREDGNNLLDECSGLIRVADSSSSIRASDVDMMKFMWCAGYLRATRDYFVDVKVRLAVLGMIGLRITGPDKVRGAASAMLDPICDLDKISILQMARVVVKWLQDHPERLHEHESSLAREALTSAFPCKSSQPEEGQGAKNSGAKTPQ